MTKLSKEICKKCRNERAGRELYPWDGIDEIDWKDGRINCAVFDYGHVWLSFNIDEIPEDCSYKLEQTVLSERPK